MKCASVASLAALVDGRILGDGSRQVRGVGDLRSAGPDQIGFVRSIRYAAAARESRAGALLVPEPLDTSCTQVVVGHVDAAFARVAAFFHPQPTAEAHRVHPSASVDPTAILHPPVEVAAGAVIEAGAEVGAGSLILANAVVGAGSRLGPGCVVHRGAVLYAGVELGARVVVHANAVVGSDGFGYVRDARGYAKVPQLGTVMVGDDVEIGAGTAIDRGTLGATRIGRGTKIDNLCHIAHNCVIGEDVAMAGGCLLSGSTILGDRVVLGGHVVSGGHLRVADDVRIGGNSALDDNVLAAGEYIGYPLSEKRRGLRNILALRSLYAMKQTLRDVCRRLGIQRPD